jgi:hypothetical protein
LPLPSISGTISSKRPAFCAADTFLWLSTEKASICWREMPNFQARFSAVWPIIRFTTGSVRPLTMPITGVSSMAGRSLANMPSFAPSERAWAISENHITILSE